MKNIICKTDNCKSKNIERKGKDDDEQVDRTFLWLH